MGDAFRERLNKIAALIDEVGPEKEPYKPKYEAAEHLDVLLAELAKDKDRYTLDLQAVAYALKGKVYSETDEPASAVNNLTVAVIYFLVRLQRADLIEALQAHSLLSGVPAFLASAPPLQVDPRLGQVWSAFADDYNNYLKCKDVLHPDTHQAAVMHDRLLKTYKEAEENPQPVVDSSDLAAEYASSLADCIGSIELDAPAEQPDNVFMTEVAVTAQLDDDLKHAAQSPFDIEQTKIRLASVIERLDISAIQLTPVICTQIIPFYILSLNYLGVIWVNRGNQKLALNILKAAESTMHIFNYTDPFLISEPLVDAAGKELHTHILYLPDPTHPFFNKDSYKELSPLLPVCSTKLISMLNTYTIYFLAQVYGEESPCQSAEYCGMTISRQYKQRKLNLDFDPQDFIINCLTLQKYYTTCNLFRPSFTLVDVAEQVLLEYGPEDRASYVKPLPNNENMPKDDVAFLQARFQERLSNVVAIRSVLDLEQAQELLAQLQTEQARMFSQLLTDSYQRLESVLEIRREEMKIQLASSEFLSDEEKERIHKQIHDSCKIDPAECVASAHELYDMLISQNFEATLRDAAKSQLRKLKIEPSQGGEPIDEPVVEDVVPGSSKLHNLILSESLVHTMFYSAYRLLLAASKYFVLDGFVSDHCQILLDISTLHQIYGYYEEMRLTTLDNKAVLEGAERPSYAPLIKLHLRRCTTLDKVLPELSREYFSKLIASLQLEVAEARTAVYTVASRAIQINKRLKKLTEDMEYAAQLQLKQVDPLSDKDLLVIDTAAAYCSKAIEAWRAVCKTYEADAQSRLLQEHHFKRKTFSHDEILNFLTFEDRDSMQNCMFETARLLSQLPTLNPVLKYGLLTDSLNCFEQVKKLWEANDTLHKKETSLQLICTTIDLLCEKIGRIANVIKDYKLNSSGSKA